MKDSTAMYAVDADNDVEDYYDVPTMVKPLGSVNMTRILIMCFTMTATLLFLMPTFLLLRLKIDQRYRYWEGSILLSEICLLLVPVFIFAVHFHNSRVEKLSIPGVVLALVVPCVVILVEANSEVAIAGSMIGQLFSIDCDMSPRKRSLQRSWDAAHDLWTKCLDATVELHPDKGLSAEGLARDFRIQDCEEYPVALESYSTDWGYLAFLEEHISCSGWCAPAPQLWAKGPAKDSCSVAVSSFFQHEVLDHANQVFMVMAIALALVIASMLAIQHDVL